jgi:subtilisin-like proprotein convertase family protein
MFSPNDPFLSSQWYISNTGQRGAQGYDLNLLPIWGRYSGKGLIIAVNDDGMDLQHPDLAANLLVNLAYDGVRQTLGQGFQSSDPEISRHGTVVGSIIGMVANNGLGGSGIAWGAKIVPALVMGKGGPDNINAQVFLSNLNANAAISVNSWGIDEAFQDNFGETGHKSDQEWGEVLTRLVSEGRGGLGMVIAVSGGNEREIGADIGLSSFTSNKFTIAVGAITHDGKPTDYSSQGASLLVTAMGGVGTEDTALDSGFGIFSADVSGALGYNSLDGAAGNYAFQNQGTSYSQPMVAAITALMLEANPKLGFRDVMSILAMTARKTDATNSSWVQQNGTEWNLGGMHFSRDFGYGLVDAAAAVRLAESWAGGTNTMTNWVSAEGVSTTPSGTIPDNTPNGFFQATATVTQGITIERLEVDIVLTAAQSNQLKALLTSPSGTTHTLFDRPLTAEDPQSAWPYIFTMGLSAFMGETSEGTWTLRLFDVVTGETATFDSFTVRAWGKDPGPGNQYVFTDEYSGSKTLSDAGGLDTLNAASVSKAVTLSIKAGEQNVMPNGSFTLAPGTVIENAFGGAGNDSITGNVLDNVLRGNAGNDTIDGGTGTDTVVWGSSSINYQLRPTATGWQVADKTATDGMDTLISVEKLQFSDRVVIVESKSHTGYANLPVELYQFFITAFNAAPGVTYMDQLAEAYNYGLSVKEIVDIFTTKSQFTSVYAPTLSNQDLATELVKNIIKTSATAEARTSATNDIKAALDIGWTVGKVIFQVFGNLAKMPLTDPSYGNTTKQFNNQITVAKYYTETLNQSTTDLETLRDVVQSVTSSTDVSTDAAIAQLIGVSLLTGGDSQVLA